MEKTFKRTTKGTSFKIVKNPGKTKTFNLSSKPKLLPKNKNELMKSQNQKILDKINKREEKEKHEDLKNSSLSNSLGDSSENLSEIINLTKEKENLEREEMKRKQNIEALKQKLIKLNATLEHKKNISKLQKEKITELRRNKNEAQKKLDDLTKRFNDLEREAEENHNNENQNDSEEEDGGIQINIGDLLARFHLMLDAAREEAEQERGLSEEDFNKLEIKTIKDRNCDKKCNLCEFEFCYNDETIILPKCNHQFHRACLSNFTRRKDKCPDCDEKIF